MLPLGGFKISQFYNNFNACGVLLNISKTAPQKITANSLKTRTLEERLGIPERPKKPLTPYFRFMKEIRPSVVLNNPKTTRLPEIVKLVAKQWETVDSVTKANLESEYKKDQILYIEKRANYDSQLTDEQKNNLKQFKQGLLEMKEKKSLRKKIKDLGKPKRPGSAFIKYLTAQRTETPQEGLTYKEWHHNITEKWRKLTTNDKEKFLRLTKTELETYKKELSKWEEKMVRLGNIDVVRHEALIEAPPAKPRRKAQE